MQPNEIASKFDADLIETALSILKIIEGEQNAKQRDAEISL